MLQNKILFDSLLSLNYYIRFIITLQVFIIRFNDVTILIISGNTFYIRKL